VNIILIKDVFYSAFAVQFFITQYGRPTKHTGCPIWQ